MTLENPPSGAPTPAATAAPATDIEAALLGLLAALRSHGITLPKAGAGLVTKRDVARMAGIGLSTLDKFVTGEKVRLRSSSAPARSASGSRTSRLGWRLVRAASNLTPTATKRRAICSDIATYALSRGDPRNPSDGSAGQSHKPNKT